MVWVRFVIWLRRRRGVRFEGGLGSFCNLAWLAVDPSRGKSSLEGIGSWREYSRWSGAGEAIDGEGVGGEENGGGEDWLLKGTGGERTFTDPCISSPELFTDRSRSCPMSRTQ